MIRIELTPEEFAELRDAVSLEISKRCSPSQPVKDTERSLVDLATKLIKIDQEGLK